MFQILIDKATFYLTESLYVGMKAIEQLEFLPKKENVLKKFHYLCSEKSEKVPRED